MEIRPIEQNDVDQFLSLWDDVFNEGQFLERASPPRERVEQVVERVVEEGLPNFVLVNKTQVVGAFEVFPATFFDIERPNAPAYGILGMQIQKPYRGQGYGRRLMEIGLLSSYDYGIEVVELDVLQSNVTAISLYEKFGFRKIEEGRQVKLPTGQITKFQRMLLNIAA
ncbi:MAG: GNAT family N-acetyltransferase [Pseudohongiellaceae bacterium]|nr:GNAT family N-acetyltransferase [Pseudohongiellaceae bacterium]